MSGAGKLDHHWGGMCLTIFHDGQFWIGVFEEEQGDVLAIARHVFGAEPSDAEVLELVRSGMPRLSAVFAGSAAAGLGPQPARRTNPKRLAREAARAVARQGTSTRSQEALRLQREGQKKQARVTGREQRDQERERRREAGRKKALKKHQGH